MKISDLFDISPEAALEAYFRQENDRRRFYKENSIFIWVSSSDEHGVSYGSFTHVSKKQLEGRKYTIQFFDGKVSIRMDDVFYIPKTYSWVHKETKECYNSIFQRLI